MSTGMSMSPTIEYMPFALLGLIGLLVIVPIILCRRW